MISVVAVTEPEAVLMVLPWPVWPMYSGSQHDQRQQIQPAEQRIVAASS
jgi:hypothetical protein